MESPSASRVFFNNSLRPFVPFLRLLQQIFNDLAELFETLSAADEFSDPGLVRILGIGQPQDKSRRSGYAHATARGDVVADLFRILAIIQAGIKRCGIQSQFRGKKPIASRFKPPPAGASDIGWRVEFRVMEVQMTAFENAAFSTFIVLLTRAHFLAQSSSLKQPG